MSQFRIDSTTVRNFVDAAIIDFPLYTKFLINQASQTAQSTRRNVVGQMSEVFPQFKNYCDQNSVPITLENWKDYHSSRFPNAVEESAGRTFRMIENFREAIDQIDEDLIKQWVENLLYEKTYYGLHIQALITIYFTNLGYDVRQASPEEEGRNIDIYINEHPYQVKPKSINYMQIEMGRIIVPIIEYVKVNDAIVLEYEDEYLDSILNNE